MLVLGVESTCDETGCAIVRDGKEILSNVFASQHDIHSQFGGVFPELASRRHVDAIIPVLDEALEKASVSLQDIDLIAVAHGPGLMGAILVGLNAAKSLAFSCQKPLIGVNHVEAHIYAAMMSQSSPPSFPSIGVVLSGAHTNIIYMHDIGSYELLAQTADDAIGEAFDKVAKMMDIPYPGGPEIEAIAKNGDPYRYDFKSGRVKKSPLNFSFSGIKTGVLYTVKGQNGSLATPTLLSESDKCHVAASFQRVVFEDIIKKTLTAARERNCNSIVFGGGVTNNNRLREMFADTADGYQLYWPSAGLSLDNAAMIAGLGYHQYNSRGSGDNLHLEAQTRITF